MTLSQRVEELTESYLNDSKRSIGEFVLREKGRIREYSTQQIAEQSYPSKAAVVRFAKALGFDGWTDFSKAYVSEQHDQQTHSSSIDPNYWLTFNEINVLVMSPFANINAGGILPPGKDVPIGVAVQTDERWDDPQKRFTALHNQLVASAKAVQTAHEIRPDCHVGCMLLGRVAYPYSCRPEDVLKAQQVMRKANYYCGDVQARGAYPAFAPRLWAEEGVRVELSQEDAEVLQQGTVDFISFSYYSSTTATTDPNVPISNGNM